MLTFETFYFRQLTSSVHLKMNYLYQLLTRRLLEWTIAINKQSFSIASKQNSGRGLTIVLTKFDPRGTCASPP